jgi:hypothetical protein
MVLPRKSGTEDRRDRKGLADVEGDHGVSQTSPSAVRTALSAGAGYVPKRADPSS